MIRHLVFYFGDTTIVNAEARFDLLGNQVNGLFGTMIAARSPRVMHAALRFSF